MPRTSMRKIEAGKRYGYVVTDHSGEKHLVETYARAREIYNRSKRAVKRRRK